MRNKSFQITTLLLCALATSACEKNDTGRVDQVAASTQVPSPQSIAQELAAGNYEKAARAAEQAIAANPADAELHLLLARAEARLQNIGAAVAALQGSFDAGFHDPRGALNNPDFDGIRSNPIFVKFASQFDRKQKVVSGPARSKPISTIRAGDVSIIENADGSSRIRAGDIELED